eukprot:TRINITY_DN103212_c0_g1_i1.p1 TRINITY_DN103212_c0_g1~~TRINITY_DN103212_c0_g1_i1.p1  ORF type:complete len:358 (+),score=98.79 TRINITY_DN103212_c0_g1_i1:201-1274(+)
MAPDRGRPTAGPAHGAALRAWRLKALAANVVSLCGGLRAAAAASDVPECTIDDYQMLPLDDSKVCGDPSGFMEADYALHAELYKPCDFDHKAHICAVEGKTVKVSVSFSAEEGEKEFCEVDTPCVQTQTPAPDPSVPKKAVVIAEWICNFAAYCTRSSNYRVTYSVVDSSEKPLCKREASLTVCGDSCDTGGIGAAGCDSIVVNELLLLLGGFVVLQAICCCVSIAVYYTCCKNKRLQKEEQKHEEDRLSSLVARTTVRKTVARTTQAAPAPGDLGEDFRASRVRFNDRATAFGDQEAGGGNRKTVIRGNQMQVVREPPVAPPRHIRATAMVVAGQRAEEKKEAAGKTPLKTAIDKE